ncbi:unnamed protein product [Microthlaspi erraticum]|uniref:Uncharacterized protein n=1 Tax=Microthlaspi erraticum TaxID=1685480 RepID=A0A6D2KF97_9BRAS|nr:unnamed protein product [Microthlaspi erraticum]
MSSQAAQQGTSDAIMDEEVQEKQLLAEEEDGMEQLVAADGLEAAQLVPEEIKAIRTGPVTRSRTKALNQVIGKVLRCTMATDKEEGSSGVGEALLDQIKKMMATSLIGETDQTRQEEGD